MSIKFKMHVSFRASNFTSRNLFFGSIEIMRIRNDKFLLVMQVFIYATEHSRFLNNAILFNIILF